VVGYVVEYGQDHRVEFPTAWIGKVAGPVERGVQRVLRVGVQQQLGRGPVAEVPGPRQPDGPAHHLGFGEAGAQTLRFYRGAALGLDIGEIGLVVLVVAGADAAVDRIVGERLGDLGPRQAVVDLQNQDVTPGRHETADPNPVPLNDLLRLVERQVL
jgi:hypothetical protein